MAKLKTPPNDSDLREKRDACCAHGCKVPELMSSVRTATVTWFVRLGYSDFNSTKVRRSMGLCWLRLVFFYFFILIRPSMRRRPSIEISKSFARRHSENLKRVRVDGGKVFWDSERLADPKLSTQWPYVSIDGGMSLFWAFRPLAPTSTSGGTLFVPFLDNDRDRTKGVSSGMTFFQSATLDFQSANAGITISYE